MSKTPIRLEHDPIVEALFELRFQPNSDSVVSLLPGMLYQQIGKDFPIVETLPHGMLPKEIRAVDPGLRYKATHRMVGDGFVILLGPNVFTVSCVGPYVGWANFRKRILSIVELLPVTELVGKLERFSLKYINILPGFEEESELEMLALSMTLGKNNLVHSSTQFRTEVRSEHYLQILQVIPETQVTAPNGEKRTGLLVDVDIVSSESMEEFWTTVGERLDAVHDAEKELFFGTLTSATLERFGPVWEGSGK